MPGSKIFLSYRRDDSSGYTELLFNRLARHYGAERVFRDVHAIRPMDPFRAVIDQALSDCAVLVVVISRQWARITDASGVRRLAQPDDVVCSEIATALTRKVPVLPVLVGGAIMPGRADLPETLQPLAEINALDVSDQRLEYDLDRLFDVVSRVVGAAPAPIEVNPFSVRAGIRDDAFFFNRTAELRMLRDYVRGRQNCQVVGPRRIGKSSLLLYVQRHCAEWREGVRAAYIDLQDPRCHTLAGWLKAVAEHLALPAAPTSLAELMEAVEDLLDSGVQPVLCLDEFGEMTRQPQEFPRAVYLTLRACGQRGMSIITAAPKRLSELTDPRDDTSPFFNTFPHLPLGPFAPDAARAFVALERDGILDFSDRERDRILELAEGYPLALQAACYHVLAARQSGEDLAGALARARADSGR